MAEVSIGDYVLAGGESATVVMTEAVTRLLPGVVGNPDSLTEESHGLGSPGLLEYPSYTKPQDWRGYPVPEVLLSGHHAAIMRWRRDQALLRTARHRPELIAALPAGELDERDRAVLAEAGNRTGATTRADAGRRFDVPTPGSPAALAAFVSYPRAVADLRAGPEASAAFLPQGERGQPDWDPPNT